MELGKRSASSMETETIELPEENVAFARGTHLVSFAFPEGTIQPGDTFEIRRNGTLVGVCPRLQVGGEFYANWMSKDNELLVDLILKPMMFPLLNAIRDMATSRIRSGGDE